MCRIVASHCIVKTTISDLVQIIPEDFRKKSAEAIEDNLNAKYSNKVVSILEFTESLLTCQGHSKDRSWNLFL